MQERGAPVQNDTTIHIQSLTPRFPRLPLQEHLGAAFNIGFWTATSASGGRVWTGGSRDQKAGGEMHLRADRGWVL